MLLSLKKYRKVTFHLAYLCIGPEDEFWVNSFSLDIHLLVFLSEISDPTIKYNFWMKYYGLLFLESVGVRKKRTIPLFLESVWGPPSKKNNSYIPNDYQKTKWLYIAVIFEKILFNLTNFEFYAYLYLKRLRQVCLIMTVIIERLFLRVSTRC